MTFAEYVRLKKTITTTNRNGECNISCADCPLSSQNNKLNVPCYELESEYPETAERLLSDWDRAKDTPFSKIVIALPNLPLDIYGVPFLCPSGCDSTFKCIGATKDCEVCRKNYWFKKLK